MLRLLWIFADYRHVHLKSIHKIYQENGKKGDTYTSKLNSIELGPTDRPEVCPDLRKQHFPYRPNSVFIHCVELVSAK